MAFLINGSVYEVHWDSPATDPNAITATELERFALAERSDRGATRRPGPRREDSLTRPPGPISAGPHGHDTSCGTWWIRTKTGTPSWWSLGSFPLEVGRQLINRD
jgi:hypothetical protein